MREQTVRFLLLENVAGGLFLLWRICSSILSAAAVFVSLVAACPRDFDTKRLRGMK